MWKCTRRTFEVKNQITEDIICNITLNSQPALNGEYMWCVTQFGTICTI